MNQTIIPFPEPDFAGCVAGRWHLRPLSLEGSLAVVLPLAPVIPLFPARPVLARPPRRGAGGKATR